MKKSIANPRVSQLKLDLLPEKPILVNFDGEDVSGNGGLLLAAQLEKATGFLKEAADRLDDHRTSSLIKHNRFEEVAQRVFQIVAGYAACSDSDFLRDDPVLKMAVGRDPVSGEALASQPSQNRLENDRSFKELYRLAQWLVDYYIQCHRKPPKHLFLDFDGSAIETYGMQLNAFYRGGPYKKNMYFPLFVFDQNGWLLVAALRPGDQGEIEMALPVLKKLVKRLRAAWPQVRITVRADGAFTSNDFYKWMDENKVQYVLGLKENHALQIETKYLRRETEKKFRRKLSEPKYQGKTGDERKNAVQKELRSIADRKERSKKLKDAEARRVRSFGDFEYAARSWNRERRVIARCDYTDKGLEMRYIVTNIQNRTAREIYEDIYCKRALAELGIKNIKETRCTRLSCSQFKANMFRLLLHAMAYTVIHQIRIKLSTPRMSFEQFRRRFVSVALRVQEYRNEVFVTISKSYHAAKEFRLVAKRLGFSPH
jgi:hypothetical protein